MDILEQNLALLAVNSPDAAAAVRAAGPPPDGVELYASRSGELTARHTLGGVVMQMHSAYDPVREAEQFVRELNLGFGHTVAWFGPGLWHGVAALMRYLFHCPVCVIEAEPSLLRTALGEADFSPVLSNPGLRVYTGSAEQMIAALRNKPPRIGWPGNYIFPKSTYDRAPGAYMQVYNFLKEMSADIIPRLDPENVVPPDTFGAADPADTRIIMSTTHRYAEAVGHVLKPAGVECRSVQSFRNFEAMEEFKPAFYLTFTENLKPGVFKMLAVIKEMGIPVVMWNLEDPKFFKRPEYIALFEETLKQCDLVFTHSRQFMHLYPHEGPKPEYLPTGARPDMHGEPGREEDMLYDYSFFGFIDDERDAFFRKLKTLLPDMKSRICGPGMAPEDYTEMIRRTRVNLTAFTTCDDGGETTWALSDRVWELPYAGGFLLQDQRRHLADHFAPDEVATFTDVRDCAEKIKHHAAHPEERARILAAARARIRAEHLWAHRVQKIITAFFTARA